MSFEIIVKEEFERDIERFRKSGQSKLLSKINSFVKDLRQDPRTGTGKPEQLKFMSCEIWSRRINVKHRLTYEINENQVILLAAWGHYNDK